MQLSSSLDVPLRPPENPTREVALRHAPAHPAASVNAGTAEARQLARVTIITRTRERPLMLRRCMASVLGQSFRDWLHVIVNDGGNPYVVDLLVAEHAARYQGRVHVIHSPVSVGMQNASNLGIGEAAGDYLVIHDDDDSWQPEFLRACVDFLDQHGDASPVQGVITHTIRVLEEINAEGAIEELAREDYMPCKSIDLFAAGADNPYAPIAFVYRRAVHERIGLFDERFSVVGDWDFNLRFLQLFEVGVISQRLANYHWRHRSGGSTYANTVTDALEVHLEKSTELRNHYLRMDLQQGQPGLGYLLNLAKTLRGNSALLWDMRQRGDQAAHEISKVHTRLRRWEWFFTRNSNLRAALQLGSPAPRPALARTAEPPVARRGAAAPRESADELAALLNRRGSGSCRVLSLDVFDTALLRVVRRPVDVFLFLEAPVRRQLGLATLPVAHMRTSAERIARGRQLALAGHEEVTLAEIYEAFCELAGADPDLHRTALMELELETEQRLLYGNAPVLAAARSAARAGIRVVYASDMYLPRAFILDCLRQHGYPVDDSATLFLSADRGASKHVGNLYDQMLSELGCAPGEVVHVGDNLHSDHQQARSRGLRAVHWRPSAKPENLPLVEQGAGGDPTGFADGDLLASVCTGIIRRRAAGSGSTREEAPGGPFTLSLAATSGATNGSNGSAGKAGSHTEAPAAGDLWDRLGYEVGGPLYLLFLRWLLEQARTEGIERLYFLARDGYYLREACDILSARTGTGVQAVYMAASRRLLNLPQVTTLDPAAWQFLLTPNPNLSVRHFLSRIGLDPGALSEEIHRAGWSSPDEIITTPEGAFRRESDLHAMRALFRRLEGDILRQAGDERGRLKAYFRQIGFSDDTHKAAIVDVGWQASSARALQTLLNLPDDPALAPALSANGSRSHHVNGARGQRLRAFYFGTWHYARPTVEAGCRLDSFYFHLDDPSARRNLVSESVELFELFFGAPHSTITGLQEGGDGCLVPVYGDCEHRNDEVTLARLQRMRERAVDFVRDAAALIPEPGPRTAGFLEWPGTGLNYLDGVLERIFRHPTLAEARQLGALEVRDSFGGNSPTRALARPPGRWQRLIDPASLRSAYEHAFWKKGFLTQLHPRVAAQLQAR